MLITSDEFSFLYAHTEDDARDSMPFLPVDCSNAVRRSVLNVLVEQLNFVTLFTDFDPQ